MFCCPVLGLNRLHRLIFLMFNLHCLTPQSTQPTIKYVRKIARKISNRPKRKGMTGRSFLRRTISLALRVASGGAKPRFSISFSANAGTLLSCVMKYPNTAVSANKADASGIQNWSMIMKSCRSIAESFSETAQSSDPIIVISPPVRLPNQEL